MHTKVPSIMWKIKNEHKARDQYLEQTIHAFQTCRLSVNAKYSHLGAILDGTVKCDCCGKGLIEINCQYKHNHTHSHNAKDRQMFS